MTGWTALVPVKPWRLAKSRLGVTPEVREAVARALTLDTLDVLTSHADIGHLVLVTADEGAANEGRARGATVIDDDSGLNDAVRRGRDWVERSHANGPTVIVPADLAYLATEALTDALVALRQAGRAHIPDLSGEGTTLLAARSASAIDPHYGIDSSRIHASYGFQRVEEVDPRMRADVDQVDDLPGDHGWTMGPRVAALVEELTLHA